MLSTGNRQNSMANTECDFPAPPHCHAKHPHPEQNRLTSPAAARNENLRTQSLYSAAPQNNWAHTRRAATGYPLPATS